MVKEIDPDLLIIAVGAKAVRPGIPGIENKNVLMIEDLFDHESDIGQKVVIIGGGLSGCEEGLYLARKGKEVTVLEMQDRLAKEGTYLHWRALMVEMEKEKNIDALTGMTCKKINNDGVVAETSEGVIQEFKADTIVIAAGFEAKTELVNDLRDCGCKYSVIGDCNKPATVMEAVHSGYMATVSI